MLLKIDLSKAFDCLSSLYIKKTLTAFGFAPPWVGWVMSLLSSSFFSVLINGIPSSPFRPSRGIRQGDPLSTFLFVIMAEGLGRSIKQAQHSQLLKGLSFNNSPAFTHQQFLDETWFLVTPQSRRLDNSNPFFRTFQKLLEPLSINPNPKSFFSARLSVLNVP